MCLITISRGSFLGAQSIAAEIAQQLQISCVSREVILQAAKEYGLSEEELSEDDYRAPLLFERLSRERESRLAAVRAALLQQAAKGAFVYHGYAAHLLIADAPTLLRIRVVAPFEMRVEAIQQERDCDRKTAESHACSLDRQRAKWTRFLYGVEWGDAALYDLVINLEKIALHEARELVCHLAANERYRRTAEDQKAIEDLALSSRVQAELGITRSSQLVIVADGGIVEMRGITFFSEHREELEAAARKVPGVKEVRCLLESSMKRLGL